MKLKSILGLTLGMFAVSLSGISTTPSENVSYAITFLNDDGSSLLENPIKCEDGEIPEYPSVEPVANNKPSPGCVYKFSGWNPKLTKATCDATYTAEYTEITGTLCTINYQSSVKGDMVLAPMTPQMHVNADKYITNVSNFVPTLTGYTFDGWYNADPSKEGAKLIDNLEGDIGSGSIDLYAKWTAAGEHKINYYDKGGEACTAENLDSLPKVHTEGKVTELVAGSKKDATFLGWYTTSDCSGSPITEISDKVISDVDLYAKWGDPTSKYNISFVNDDGNKLRTDSFSAGEIPEYIGVRPDAAIVPEQKDIYAKRFTGWTPAISVVTGDATYTATYETVLGKFHSISYYKGDSPLQPSDLAAMSPMSHICGDGEATALLDPKPIDGSTFEGWYEDSSFSGSAITSIADSCDKDITLYGKWTSASTKTIRYLDQGGTEYSGNNGDKLVKEYTPGISVILFDGVKTNYTFGGWYKELDCSGTPVTSIGAKETGDVTLYAKWTTGEKVFSTNSIGGYYINSKKQVKVQFVSFGFTYTSADYNSLSEFGIILSTSSSFEEGTIKYTNSSTEIKNLKDNSGRFYTTYDTTAYSLEGTLIYAKGYVKTKSSTIYSDVISARSNDKIKYIEP